MQYNSDKDNVGQIHFCNNESNENYLPVRLRQGLTEEDLAFGMKVSQSTVNRIVTTWISWPTGYRNLMNKAHFLRAPS